MVGNQPVRGVALWPAGGKAFRRGGRGGPGGRRGKVTRFSERSRDRLRLAILSRVSPTAAGEHRLGWLTLTTRSGTAAEIKASFRAVLERVRRSGVRCGVIWRLEYQARGVPHLHLLVECESTPALLAVCKEIVTWWLRVRGGDASPAAQCFKFVRSSAGLSLYVSDMSKVDQSNCGSDAPGRWWGVAGRDFFCLVFPVLVYGHTAYFEFIRLVRQLRTARRRAAGKRRWRGRGVLSEFWEIGDWRVVAVSVGYWVAG